MRAITIWQPWASLIACGAKRFETRGWQAKPGPIAIHAAAKRTKELDRLCAVEPFYTCLKSFGRQWGNPTPRGYVIATAELVKCHRVEDIRDELSEQELAFGDYSDGMFAWDLSNVVPLVPAAATGKQGLWEWEQPK